MGLYQQPWMWDPQKPWQGQGLESLRVGGGNPQLWCRKSACTPRLGGPRVLLEHRRSCGQALEHFQTYCHTALPRRFRAGLGEHSSSQHSGFLAPSTKLWVEKEGRRRACRRPSTFFWVEVSGKGCWKRLVSQGPTESFV